MPKRLPDNFRGNTAQLEEKCIAFCERYFLDQGDLFFIRARNDEQKKACGIASVVYKKSEKESTVASTECVTCSADNYEKPSLLMLADDVLNQDYMKQAVRAIQQKFASTDEIQGVLSNLITESFKQHINISIIVLWKFPSPTGCGCLLSGYCLYLDNKAPITLFHRECCQQCVQSREDGL